MEEFKMKIKRREILFTVMTLVAVAFGIYNVFIMSNSTDASMADGIITGFQFGIIFGMGILASIQLIKLNSVIKDETKLKMLYNQEHDERSKAIRSKAGMPMLMITSILMLIAAIIAGYFNIIVFYTLVIAATVQLSIGIIVKLYYMRTM